MLILKKASLVILLAWTVLKCTEAANATTSSNAQTIQVATHISGRQKKDYRRLKKQEGAVKLVGGERGTFEGNVEILHKSRWGSVCDDEWDEQEAQVVCRQLGYDSTKARATTSGYFGQARRRYWMTGLMCNGSESHLSACRFDGWAKSECGPNEAAGVICNPLIGLDEPVNGTDYCDEANVLLNSNVIKRSRLSRIKDVHRRGIALRLAGPRHGRLEAKLAESDWGVVCGDGWSLLEAGVICRQLGLGYATQAFQKDFYGSSKLPMALSGIKCFGNETNVAECLHHTVLDCPGVGENVAGVSCSELLSDLVIDHLELERTAHLEDRQLYWLQCAMEENCVASRAYHLQRESEQWMWETRRLLRFTARIFNAGTADFRPALPKNLWEWHMCHMHYHSMEVFATFDIIDSSGKRVAEGHKASFCLEDNQCLVGIKPKYKCANYGDQGISVNCSDIYRYNIDCQWIDISELSPGFYKFKVTVNPEFKVGEMSFDNNAATCKLHYTETSARVHDCVMGRP
ncbi:hypothetical protein QAD02_023617 [Eretmocerus hayati]|uniref:Uncharacterized protein n=1 Tax=Eretmocerus hayati TaxID=131215 RepID=A0ACC2PXZ2_9HYME|nr:hypothetical protein QAD02_023617 [Eretmocerus hayati]